MCNCGAAIDEMKGNFSMFSFSFLKCSSYTAVSLLKYTYATIVANLLLFSFHEVLFDSMLDTAERAFY